MANELDAILDPYLHYSRKNNLIYLGKKITPNVLFSIGAYILFVEVLFPGIMEIRIFGNILVALMIVLLLLTYMGAEPNSSFNLAPDELLKKIETIEFKNKKALDDFKSILKINGSVQLFYVEMLFISENKYRERLFIFENSRLKGV